MAEATICCRSSCVGAWSDSARFRCGASCVICLMRGTTPTVEMVTWWWLSAKRFTSHMPRTAAITAG